VRKLLLLTVALIVYGSLYPFEFHFGPGHHPLEVLLHSWPASWDRWEFRDVCINLMFYAPFGAAALWAIELRFSRLMSIALVIFAALALSTTMELLQVFVPTRISSLCDVVSNVAGATGGALLALLYHPAAPRRGAGTSAPPGALLLLALFVGYELYPFFPVLSRTRLLMNVNWILHPPVFLPYDVLCCAAEWLAAMVVAHAIVKAIAGRPLEMLLPPLLLCCLPLRLVMLDRSESAHEVLGGALAIVAWPFLKDRLRVPVVLWLMAAAILVRELAPFHFAPNPEPFSWIPFGASLIGQRDTAAEILFRKGFDYAVLVWLLAQSKLTYWRAGTTVAASLFVLELVQCYLPGRTPETTDAVLTLLLTLILWILGNFQRRQGLA
jgi:VanZ family protein